MYEVTNCESVLIMLIIMHVCTPLGGQFLPWQGDLVVPTHVCWFTDISRHVLMNRHVIILHEPTNMYTHVHLLQRWCKWWIYDRVRVCGRLWVSVSVYLFLWGTRYIDRHTARFDRIEYVNLVNESYSNDLNLTWPWKLNGYFAIVLST